MTHDELVMWAYNNAELIVGVFDYSERFGIPRGNSDMVVIESKTWEVPIHHPVGRDRKIEVGFMDLVISARVNFPSRRKEWRYPPGEKTVSRRKEEAGFVEWVEELKPIKATEWVPGDGPSAYDRYSSEGRSPEVREVDYTASRPFSVVVEAKPRIESVGALIRQLRGYQQYGAVVVVSPDDSYARLLKEQGFMFYRAPRDLKNLELGL